VRKTSIIYRRELGSYLRSPLGYVIAALFLLAVGILFQSEALGKGKMLSADVLRKFFMFSSGATVVASIALAIRLLAEERQQHTIVLLNTSPVRDVEIVLGKFLAALTFLALMLALSVYIPLLIKVNGKITGAQVLVGYLGLFLLGATSLAIGLLASALSRHQLIAAAVGAALAFLVYSLYPMAVRLNEPLKGVIQDLGLWHVHFAGSFMQGVFSLKDAVYYLAMTYFFLLLATKVMEAKRWQ
jgi:ABC-2 type transport system permease protein